MTTLMLVGGGQGRTRLSGPVVEFSVGGKLMGSIADYGSIQEAVDAAPEGGAVIRIRQGVYREVVRVAKRGVQLRADAGDPGKVVVVFASGGECGAVCPAVLTVTGDDFFAEGLTVANDWKGSGAAVAMMVSGDRGVFREVRVLGGLVLGSKDCAGAPRCGISRQYFSGCLVDGIGNLVVGQGRAVFKGCELRERAGVGGKVEAEVGPVLEHAGWVFDHCRMTGQRQVSVGRPWGKEPVVVLLHTEMRVGFAAEGTAGYSEFDSSGEAAGRDARVKRMTGEEARAYEPGVFLRANDKWEPEKVR